MKFMLHEVMQHLGQWSISECCQVYILRRMSIEGATEWGSQELPVTKRVLSDVWHAEMRTCNGDIDLFPYLSFFSPRFPKFRNETILNYLFY